jgi:hypothetical protein
MLWIGYWLYCPWAWRWGGGGGGGSALCWALTCRWSKQIEMTTKSWSNFSPEWKKAWKKIKNTWNVKTGRAWHISPVHNNCIFPKIDKPQN